MSKTDVHLDDREVHALTRPIVQALDRLTEEVKLLRATIAGSAIGLGRVARTHLGDPGPDVPVPEQYRSDKTD